MLRVTLLGTAATMPLPDRALTAAAMSICGRTLLLDCGEGTQTALHRHHVNPMHVDMICLSHYHGDHIFGLPGLMQTMGVLGRTEPLYITGPEGLHGALAPILALAEEQPYPIRLLPLPPSGLTLRQLHPAWPAGAVLTTFATCHRTVSQGYRLHLPRQGRFEKDKAAALGLPHPLWRLLQQGQTVAHDGRSITPDMVCGQPRRGLTAVFSGDTAPCDSLADAAQDADLLIMDATYARDDLADKAALFGHSTFSQAAALAARAQVRQLWLSHYSAMIEQPGEHLADVQRIFPAAVCGQDGLTAHLTFDK